MLEINEQVEKKYQHLTFETLVIEKDGNGKENGTFKVK